MARESVSFGYFVRALQSMNRRVVVEPMGNALGAMVYLRLPMHPDSNPATGLWEILAVPSPKHFKPMPKYDIEHHGKWVRGWGTFFRAVKKMKDPMGRLIFNPKDVERLFIKPYRLFDSRGFKAALNEKNESPEAKINRKLRLNFKSLHKAGV